MHAECEHDEADARQHRCALFDVLLDAVAHLQEGERGLANLARPARAKVFRDAAAFAEFQHGKRPGVVPSSALYYHTRSVSPGWTGFREVAEIGAHVFFAPL